MRTWSTMAKTFPQTTTCPPSPMISLCSLPMGAKTIYLLLEMSSTCCKSWNCMAKPIWWLRTTHSMPMQTLWWPSMQIDLSTIHLLPSSSFIELASSFNCFILTSIGYLGWVKHNHFIQTMYRFHKDDVVRPKYHCYSCLAYISCREKKKKSWCRDKDSTNWISIFKNIQQHKEPKSACWKSRG